MGVGFCGGRGFTRHSIDRPRKSHRAQVVVLNLGGSVPVHCLGLLPLRSISIRNSDEATIHRERHGLSRRPPPRGGSCCCGVYSSFHNFWSNLQVAIPSPPGEIASRSSLQTATRSAASWILHLASRPVSILTLTGLVGRSIRLDMETRRELHCNVVLCRWWWPVL